MGKRFEVVGGPVSAILFGMVLALVLRGRNTSSLADGVKFISKKILRYAVILLGFGMNLADILAKGAQSLPIFMGACCWIAIAAVGLGIQHLLGIW